MSQDREKRIAKKAKQLGLSSILSLEEAQAEMTKRLLSGWTMLNKTCPVTEYPLVAKDGETYSIRCMMPVQAQGESDSTTKPVSPYDPNGPPSQQADATTLSHSDPVREKETSASKSKLLHDPNAGGAPTEASQQPQSSKRSRDAQSASISNKLLQGWIMMSETCPVTEECPLMKDPKTGRLWSAALDAFVEDIRVENDKETVSSATDGERLSNLSHSPTRSLPAPERSVRPQQADPSPAAMRNQEKSFAVKVTRENQSKALAEKMLQGWKMLAEECPTGECPLMLDPKSGRKWSVAMDRFVDENPAPLANGVKTDAPAVAKTEPKRESPPPSMNQQSSEAKLNTSSDLSWDAVKHSIRNAMVRLTNRMDALQFHDHQDFMQIQEMLNTIQAAATCYEKISNCQ